MRTQSPGHRRREGALARKNRDILVAARTFASGSLGSTFGFPPLIFFRWGALGVRAPFHFVFLLLLFLL